MKNSFLYILEFVFVLGIFTAKAQEMGFEEYHPESTLVVPEHKVTRAKYPFVDIHSHQRDMSPRRLKELVRDMDGLNEAVMVNLSGGFGERLAEMVENIEANCPGRIVVFANIDFDGIGTPGWTERAVAQLEEDVRKGAKGLKVFKSLGLRYTDSKGERVAVDDARLDPIWEKCGELGIPVLIHSADPKPFWDPMDARNERWLELKIHPRRKRSDTDPAPWQRIIDEQHRMFKKHPGTQFINAHMGWYANNLWHLGRLLDDIPNMSVGIAAVIAELGRQPKMRARFL